jgi:hypothetical protein
MRLLPRVGERPAGADLGVLEPLDTLLLSFLTGDMGFKMDRGREGASLIGLLKSETEGPSLLLETTGVELDFVRTKGDGLKKSLL